MSLFDLEAVRSRRRFGTQALDRSALVQHVFLSVGDTTGLKFCITIKQI